MCELFLHLLAGELLDGAALLQKLDQRAGLADVLEVGRNHRVEGLFDQLLDVAEALDHQRGLLIVDVDHHRKRQGRLEGILGDERDLRQVFIIVVRADLGADPFQDDVGGRDGDHLAGIGVEGILARQERFAPNTAVVPFDQLAVTIILAGKIVTHFAGIRDHHADITDFDDRLLDHLDRGKQAVDVIRAFHQHLQLAAAETAGPQEVVRILEFVMILLLL